MIILGIDPGPVTSGVVVLAAPGGVPSGVVQAAAGAANKAVLSMARQFGNDYAFYHPHVVCEWLTTYGNAVGSTVLDTARFVGRVEDAARKCDVHLLTRPDVCLELCQSRRARKSEVRAALLEMFPLTGGGKVPQVGTKKQPGPLYGVTSHAWDALAVAVAWARREGVVK